MAEKILHVQTRWRMSSKTNFGFTLIEVIITLAVISIALVPISGTIIAGLTQHSSGALLVQAAFLAQHLVEEILGVDLSSTECAEVFGQHAPAVVSQNPRFSYTRAIYALEEGLWRLEVSVTWQDGVSARSYRLVTLRD